MKCEPEKLAEKQKINKAVEDSKENVAKKVFSDELNKKFNDLEIAIQEEERRLQELYDIGKELSNFVIIVNVKNEFECKFEIDKKQKIDEFNSRMDELEKEYETKNDELKKEYILKKSELENQNKQEKIELEKQNKQKSMELDKEYETKNSELEKEYEVKNSELEEKYQSKKTELTREIEEYNYNIKREKKLSNDAWEDEKERREKEISDKENEVLRSYEEVETKKNHLKELEEIVDSMPSKLNDEYQKGRKDAIIEIEKENKYKTKLLKKDFEGIVARQNDKIEALQISAC